MVKRSYFLAVLFCLTIALAAASTVKAQSSIVYSVDHQWAQIFINPDGTIDLTYNLTLTVTQGTIHSFDVGQPNQDFTIGEAVDQYGNQLNKYKYTPDVASVDFKQPLNPGDSIWYTITTNVAGMFSNDTTNPGNYGMEFAPQWLAISINDVRIQIVMPEGVTINDVKTLPDKFWNSTSTVEGRTAVFWQISTLQPNQQYPIGVSFPAQFLPNYVPTQHGGIGLETLATLIILPIIAIIIIVLVVRVARKSSYSSPKVSMETLGVKRGLTAVEASYLLDLKPTQIVTEILYSLLKKRAVWAESTKPSLKLRILPPFENKTGTAENPLRFYEIDFLNSLKADGTLDEEKLAHTIMALRDTVEQKLQWLQQKRHRGLLPQNRHSSMDTSGTSWHSRVSIERLR